MEKNDKGGYDLNPRNLAEGTLLVIVVGSGVLLVAHWIVLAIYLTVKVAEKA